MKNRAISFSFFASALVFTPISAYVSIPLLLLALIFLLRSKSRITLNLLDKLQLGLLCSILISSVFAVYKGHSFLCGSIFLCYILSYFLARLLLTGEKEIYKLLTWLSCAVLIICIIGIVQYFTKFQVTIKDIPVLSMKGGRISSICYNPLILASFLGFLLPLFIAFFITCPPSADFACPPHSYGRRGRREGYKRIVLGISIILTFITFFFTVSRAPAIALIISLTVLIYLLIHRKLIAIVSSIVLITVCLVYTPLRLRFIGTFNPSTDRARKVTIIPGIRMWKQHSILTGVGVHNFYMLYDKYCLHGEGRGPHYIHCMYLNFLVDTGIIGFSVLMAIFIILIRWSWQIYREETNFKRWVAAALFSSFTGFFIHNIVDNTPYVTGLGILFWAGMGIISGIHKTPVDS